ncbi:MAG: hypothetical protein KDD70_16820 [Bdellovibrionales bacterium]|nr:hypothetical protein [Bdellovibrionales bacterium]
MKRTVTLYSAPRYCVVPLLLSLVLSSSVGYAQTGNAQTGKIRPQIIAGSYQVGGVLQELQGDCNLLNTGVIVGSTLTASVVRREVTVQSFSSITGKLRKNGRYRGDGLAELSPTISFVSEQLKGKFTYNRKRKRVQFRGSYTVETTFASQRDCFARYLITYLSN